MEAQGNSEGMKEQIAEGVINEGVALGGSGEAVIGRIEKDAQGLEAGEKSKVKEYVNGVRDDLTGVFVTDLGAGIGGQFDGSSIIVTPDSLVVDASIRTTIARTDEVGDHERYHQANDHTAPIHVMAETKGDIAAVIGGVEFTQTALIEGLTVMQTGDQFVSVQYVEYKQNLQKAMANADLSIGDIEEAVNEKKDVTKIDDRAQQEAPETSYALAG